MAVAGARDKESTAIIDCPGLALDRASKPSPIQNIAGTSRPRAGRCSIRNEKAGMQAKLRMNEKKDKNSLANAERRSVKYGSHKKNSRK